MSYLSMQATTYHMHPIQIYFVADVDVSEKLWKSHVSDLNCLTVSNVS